MFLEGWLDRKVAVNRELTLIEGIAVLIAYLIHWLTNPYD